MGLFKKKEEVPKIPTSPSLPSLPSLPPIAEEQSKKDLPGLPSFPTNSKNENLNQEMVKSAVSDMPSSGEKEMHMETPEGFHAIEELKGESMIPPKPSAQSSIPELPKSIVPTSQKLEPPKTQAPSVPVHLSQVATQAPKQNEPIFVRIDKFQVAQKNFEEIKSKITEIELVLKKIKDVKSQEEEELKGWTEDIEKLKSRLMEIDSDIFSQL